MKRIHSSRDTKKAADLDWEELVVILVLICALVWAINAGYQVGFELTAVLRGLDL